MRHGQCAEFLIEVDQILATLVVQCFEDKSAHFAVANELTPATPWAYFLAHGNERAIKKRPPLAWSGLKISGALLALG